MNYDVLKAELTDDPLARGYSGMSDAEAAADLNSEYRPKNRESISGDEAFACTDATEFSTLTDHKRILWVSWCGKQTIDPFEAANVAFVDWLFGDNSDTIDALNVIRITQISRAEDLELGEVKEAHVHNARQ